MKDKIYFDLFQARFMAVPEKAEMLDMVSASVVFDSGRTFGTSIGSLWADFRNGITRNDEWSTIYGRESDTWVKKVADIFVALG